MKYIYFDKRKGNYVITKRVDGKKYNFGSYKSLKECEKARDYFEEHGWGNCLNERLKFSYTKHDNITWLKSKRVALNMVESLEKVNWNTQLLSELNNNTKDSIGECPRCGRAFA